MIRICYSIHHHGDRKFGEKPPFEDLSETGGICDRCFPIEKERLTKEIEEHQRAKNQGREDS